MDAEDQVPGGSDKDRPCQSYLLYISPINNDAFDRPRLPSRYQSREVVFRERPSNIWMKTLKRKTEITI